ncbi:MAG TPA: hypothetical protein ENN83_15195, partial [Rhodovulum sp.]|nr:hypothetical protein [Rhodovulum sp.]
MHASAATEGKKDGAVDPRSLSGFLAGPVAGGGRVRTPRHRRPPPGPERPRHPDRAGRLGGRLAGGRGCRGGHGGPAAHPAPVRGHRRLSRRDGRAAGARPATGVCPRLRPGRGLTRRPPAASWKTRRRCVLLLGGFHDLSSIGGDFHNILRPLH